eukprot:scaffold34348_cov102-Phaeocystis_antarctica.AAC.1
MSVETTVALSRHPMIVGLKDATGDNARVAPMRAIIGDDFRLYSGAARGRMCTACARHVHWACALGVCALHVHWALCVHCAYTVHALLLLTTYHLLPTGEDGMARDYVLQGGDGVISVTANVAPCAVAKVMAA